MRQLSRTRGKGRTLVEGAAPPSVAIAELVSSGAGVLAVCADASRRAALASGATGLARFNGGAALIACHRCGREAWRAWPTGAKRPRPDRLRGARARARAGPCLRARRPRRSAARRRGRTAGRVARPRTAHPAILHQLWTEAEQEFAGKVLAEQWPTREGVAGTSARCARWATPGAGGCGRRSPAAAATRSRRGQRPPLPRPPRARLLQGAPEGGAGVVRVVSSERTDLQRSAAFRAYDAKHSEAQRYLARPKPP